MSAGPGRIIETIDIDTERPRHVDEISEDFVKNRNHIIGLLRHGSTDDH